MSSMEDFNKARQNGTTVGHQWKRLSENREQVPPADSFEEAVRMSSDNPEPFTLAPFTDDDKREWARYLNQGPT